MPTLNTGWRSPGTVENVDRDSKTAWDAPTNILYYIVDNVSTNAVVATTYSDWIRCTNFGFKLPSDCTILGIELRMITDTNTITPDVKDSAIYLRKTSGQAGDNKANTSDVWYYAGNMYPRYRGSTSDTWNAGLTVEDIMSSDFGVDISVQNTHASTTYTAKLWNVSIRITYSCDNATDFTLTTSGSSVVRAGSNGGVWTDINNIKVEDSNYAVFTYSGTPIPYGAYTDWLVANNFGFNIPSNATISGVLVEFGLAAGNDLCAYICTDSVGLVDDAGSSIGVYKNPGWAPTNNLATLGIQTDYSIWVCIESDITYGACDDLWGATLTPAIVNSPNFGVRISPETGNVYNSGLAKVYDVKMVIFYGLNAREYSPIPRFLRGF